LNEKDRGKFTSGKLVSNISFGLCDAHALEPGGKLRVRNIAAFKFTLQKSFNKVLPAILISQVLILT